jgi:rare lipoprotein A (peptidoglycan hydrolase)
MLALLTAAGCSALCTAGALAAGAGSTGGTGAPDGAQPSSATPAHAAPASALATWYGPGLYGRRTACGQTLTTALVGVANRSLPCGTLVRMSYGSRSVVLPVIDRGPYGRIGAQWDLTAGAAAALGMTETVRVAAHVVGSAPNSATLGMPAAASAAASAESLAGGASAD